MGKVVARRVSSMEEQREEELEELELEEELELLWVEVRRVGKEKGIFSFVFLFGLGFLWWSFVVVVVVGRLEV